MAKVLGVGGVFFKSPDPKKRYEWSTKWLGMEFEDRGIAYFPKDMPANAQTVWSAFDSGTSYFAPSKHQFMFNLIVDDLVGAPKIKRHYGPKTAQRKNRAVRQRL